MTPIQIIQLINSIVNDGKIYSPHLNINQDLIEQKFADKQIEKLRKEYDNFYAVTDDKYKRLCLSCLVRRKVEIIDSEWHALFECPLNDAPRALFSYAHPLNHFGFPEINALDCLVALVLQSHTDERLTDDFALWVVGTLACRRKEFRALSPS